MDNCAASRDYTTATIQHESSMARTTPMSKNLHNPKPTYTTHRLGSMEISQLHVEGILSATKHRNQMPLPLSPAMHMFLRSELTIFFQKYGGIATFTATDPSSRTVIVKFHSYYTEAVRQTVMMIHGYECRNWVPLQLELWGIFLHNDSQANSFTYMHHYLEQLCATLCDSHRLCNHAEFGGLYLTESRKLYLHMFNLISEVVTKLRMIC
jgi:hypothetical protein